MSKEAVDRQHEYLRAFRRECVGKLKEFSAFQRLYDLVLQRTTGETRLQLAELIETGDVDERTIRRLVDALRAELERVCLANRLLYIIDIREAKAGRQTAEALRFKNTFELKPNFVTGNFYKRKWWRRLLSNIPDKPGQVICVHSIVEANGEEAVPLGETRMLARLAESFRELGVETQEGDAEVLTKDPDESPVPLVLLGNGRRNYAIRKITFPEEAVLRLDEELTAIRNGKEIGWRDGAAETSRTVYCLVSTFKLKDSNRYCWLFEAWNHRVIEALSVHFYEGRNLEELFTHLGLTPVDELDEPLQLVFAADLNRRGELVGANGNVTLVYPPRAEPVVGPSQPPIPGPRTPVIQMTRQRVQA